MDTEIWFYLIIAAISIIISIVGKKKKQAQKASKPYVPYSKPVENRNIEIRDLFDMLDTNIKNDEELTEFENIEELPKERSFINSEVPIDTNNSSLDTIPEEEGEIATFDFNDSKINIEKKVEDIVLFDINTFDIEQAVIYSEILKRKEY